MTTNPLYNALLAVAYIVGVVTLIFFTMSGIGNSLEETIVIPLGMLSLLVLSVAIMAYLFFFQPVVLLLDNEREKAVNLFLRTVGMFAIAVVVVFLVSIIAAGLIPS